MTSSFAQPSTPPQDGSFTYLRVGYDPARGAPPRDAAFSNLVVDPRNYSFGLVPQDLGVSKLAVNNTVVGTNHIAGYGVIGRV